MDKNQKITANHDTAADVADRPPSPVAQNAQPRSQEGTSIPGGRVRSAEYGMNYDPRNQTVVERARSLPDQQWNELPIEMLPAGTPLRANEETLKKESIDKVVSGAEPLRAGYVTKLWRDKNGELHIVDGHHRAAMHHALGKAMPVRIMDEAAYYRLTGTCR